MVDPSANRFSGQVTIRVSLEEETDTLWLHGDDLEVSRATVVTDSAEIEATWEEVHEDGLVRLRPSAAVGPGVVSLRFTLRGLVRNAPHWALSG